MQLNIKITLNRRCGLRFSTVIILLNKDKCICLLALFPLQSQDRKNNETIITQLRFCMQSVACGCSDVGVCSQLVCVCVWAKETLRENCQLMKNKHDAIFYFIYNVHPRVHMLRLDFMGSNIYATEKCSAVICIVVLHCDST